MDLKFGRHTKDHHISNEFEGQGHRSKVKVTKVKHVKIPVFSLVSEKVVQGQGVKVKVTKVVGQVHEGQGQCHKSQGRRVKVKVVLEVLYPIDSQEVRHAGFSFYIYSVWPKKK